MTVLSLCKKRLLLTGTVLLAVIFVGSPDVQIAQNLNGDDKSTIEYEVVRSVTEMERLDPGTTRIKCVGINDSHLEFLSRFENLTDLDLSWNRGIRGSGIWHLGKLKQLSSLDLRHCHKLGDFCDENEKNISLLSLLPNLEELGFDYNIIKSLGDLDELKRLKVNASEFEDPMGLKRKDAKEMKKWESWPIVGLDVSHCDISDEELRGISNFQKLTELDLSGNDHFTDAGIAHIAKLSNLRKINLSNTTINDDGFYQLSKLTNLQYLDLYFESEKYFSAKGFKHLSKVKSLQSLNLIGTDINTLELAQIEKLSNLETLAIFGNGITDAGIKRVANMDSIKVLTICDCDNIGVKGVEDIGSMKLERLNIVNCDEFNNVYTVGRLCNISTLKELQYWGCAPASNNKGGNESTVYEFKLLENLKRLAFVNTEFSPDKAAVLQDLLPDCSVELLDTDQDFTLN